MEVKSLIAWSCLSNLKTSLIFAQIKTSERTPRIAERKSYKQGNLAKMDDARWGRGIMIGDVLWPKL